MGIRFACHGCGKPLNIKHELAGKRGVCPACQLRFRIPREDQEYSLPLDPSATDATASDAPAAEIDIEEVAAAFDPFEDPSAQWYVRPPSGGRYGPANGTTMRQWIAQQRITPDSLLWRDGWPQWRKGSEFVPQWSPEHARSSSAVLSKPLPAAPQASSNLPSLTEKPGKLLVSSGVGREQSPGEAIEAAPRSPLASEPRGSHELHDPWEKRRQQKAKQRSRMIAILLAIILLLVIVVVWILLRPAPESPPGQQTSRLRPIPVAALRVFELRGQGPTLRFPPIHYTR